MLSNLLEAVDHCMTFWCQFCTCSLKQSNAPHVLSERLLLHFLGCHLGCDSKTVFSLRQRFPKSQTYFYYTKTTSVSKQAFPPEATTRFNRHGPGARFQDIFERKGRLATFDEQSSFEPVVVDFELISTRIFQLGLVRDEQVVTEQQKALCLSCFGTKGRLALWSHHVHSQVPNLPSLRGHMLQLFIHGHSSRLLLFPLNHLKNNS